MKKLLAVLVLVLIGAVSYAQWSTNGSMVYYNGGNVGIGTSTPGFLLTIEGAAGGTFYLQRPLGAGTGPIGQFRMLNNSATPSQQDWFNFSFRNFSGYPEIVQSAYYAATSTTKAFAYFNVGTGKYEIRLGVSNVEFQNTGNVFITGTGTGNGRLGIGTTNLVSNTAVKLQVEGQAYVNGRVRCTEVEVALTFSWPDYVFSSGYKLPSLYDVENFINTNNHLPGIPSQAEIASDGVKLGEMNATLLKKVEELTLYMINLQKENDALKARVSRLEK